jgi:hypothetical protein
MSAGRRRSCKPGYQTWGQHARRASAHTDHARHCARYACCAACSAPRPACWGPARDCARCACCAACSAPRPCTQAPGARLAVHGVEAAGRVAHDGQAARQLHALVVPALVGGPLVHRDGARRRGAAEQLVEVVLRQRARKLLVPGLVRGRVVACRASGGRAARPRGRIGQGLPPGTGARRTGMALRVRRVPASDSDPAAASHYGAASLLAHIGEHAVGRGGSARLRGRPG